MTDLDSLLLQEEPVEQKVAAAPTYNFDELYISSYAYEKAFAYARLIMRRRLGTLEIGGFLTVPKDSTDRIARDAFLARDQEVGGAHYKVEAADVEKAKKEIEEKGQRIIGWWHSHGSLDTFHSGTDDNNQNVVLNQISPSNYISLPQESAYALQSRVEGNRLVFWGVDNPGRVFELELKNESPELVAERLKIQRERRIGFAYSMVVNNRRWLKQRNPYCVVSSRDICLDCKHPEVVNRRVTPRLFDFGEKVNENELVDEIREKVHVYERSRKRSFYLPSQFQAQRDAGNLTVPENLDLGILDSILPSKKGKRRK